MSNNNLPPGVSPSDIPGDRPEDHGYYKMDKNIIHNEDCLSDGGLKRLPDKSVDMTLTDIPYGEVNRDSNGLRDFDKGDADDLTFDLDDFISECVRVTTGSIYVFCGTEQVSYIRNKLDSAGLSTRLIIWEKTNPAPINGQYIWLSGIETCVYGKKPGATFNGHCRNTVLKYPSGKSKKHPTQKNLELFKDLIKTSSNKGDIILDPCMGSGTAALASKQLGRDYIGFEINKDYIEIAKDRLSDVQRDLIQ